MVDSLLSDTAPQRRFLAGSFNPIHNLPNERYQTANRADYQALPGQHAQL